MNVIVEDNESFVETAKKGAFSTENSSQVQLQTIRFKGSASLRQPEFFSTEKTEQVRKALELAVARVNPESRNRIMIKNHHLFVF